MPKGLKIFQNHDEQQKSRGVLVVVVLLAIVGCAGNYGKLMRNQETNAVFKSYRILPDHRYYFSGPEGRPDAIMGIQRAYTLETAVWTEFDPCDGTLKKWIDSINFYHHTRVQFYPYGFDILGPDGERIGIWYSIWDWTTVLVEADKRVKIYPPSTQAPFGNGDRSKRMKLE